MSQHKGDLGPRTIKLLSIASPAIGTSPRRGAGLKIDGPPGTSRELEALLEARNGFYAFESALHFFGSGPTAGELSLEEWNRPETWIDSYEGLASGLFFFAEDAFGDQFCLRHDAVCRFNAETGECAPMGATIEEWADRILSNYEYETGYPAAHEWQIANGTIAPGSRLFPKKLFTLGGAYTIDNLGLVDAVEGMRCRGSLATQFKGLPDGTDVRIEVVRNRLTAT